MVRLAIPLNDEMAIDLLRAWGVPYSWGAGRPSSGIDSWPDGEAGLLTGKGWDCSGFAQAACVRMGILSEHAPDRTAAGLWDASALLPRGAEQLGDLAFYGIDRISHVMVVLAPGVVLGASGGGRRTNANDPAAFVRLERLEYRKDFRGARRLPGGPIQPT